MKAGFPQGNPFCISDINIRYGRFCLTFHGNSVILFVDFT